MTEKIRKRKCPQCSGPVENSSTSFPFCSARCQQLDLGAWATEKYRIAATETDEDSGADLEQEIDH